MRYNWSPRLIVYHEVWILANTIMYFTYIWTTSLIMLMRWRMPVRWLFNCERSKTWQVYLTRQSFDHGYRTSLNISMMTLKWLSHFCTTLISIFTLDPIPSIRNNRILYGVVGCLTYNFRVFPNCNICILIEYNASPHLMTLIEDLRKYAHNGPKYHFFHVYFRILEVNCQVRAKEP